MVHFLDFMDGVTTLFVWGFFIWFFSALGWEILKALFGNCAWDSSEETEKKIQDQLDIG